MITPTSQALLLSCNTLSVGHVTHVIENEDNFPVKAVLPSTSEMFKPQSRLLAYKNAFSWSTLPQFTLHSLYWENYQQRNVIPSRINTANECHIPSSLGVCNCTKLMFPKFTKHLLRLLFLVVAFVTTSKTKIKSNKLHL